MILAISLYPISKQAFDRRATIYNTTNGQITDRPSVPDAASAAPPILISFHGDHYNSVIPVIRKRKRTNEDVED